VRLVALAAEHEPALRDFLADFARAGERVIPAYFAEPGWTHAEIVERFAASARGEVPAGRVPATTSFLVDEDGRILGVSNLRHALDERLELFGGHVGYSVRPGARGKGHATHLLRGAMELARRLGIERLRLTCAPDNLASARVIEKCGGVLRDEIFVVAEQLTVRRYDLDLTPR
jgi:predicted acetyltransferase